MTRYYTQDEAVNELSPEARVYIFEDGRGYLNSTLQFPVQDPTLAGSWALDFACEIAKVLGRLSAGARTFRFEPVPAKIEITVDGVALAAAIASVPAGYQWLLRSHEQGFFANVMSPEFVATLGQVEPDGHSYRAIADTPQEALAGAVRQVQKGVV